MYGAHYSRHGVVVRKAYILGKRGCVLWENINDIGLTLESVLHVKYKKLNVQYVGLLVGLMFIVFECCPLLRCVTHP